MKLKHPFKDETRWLFHDARYNCFKCHGNGQDCGGMELHHIYGRVSGSAFNAAPLCKKCHSKVGHTDEEHRDLLLKTILYLAKQNYLQKTEDVEFLERVRQDLDSLL